MSSKRQRAGASRNLQFERLECRQLMAADVVISEFLASNSGGLEDGDGDSSDWIELYNTTGSAIDLEGYYLTDDAQSLTKWAFPAGVTIAPQSTLLVFASDKDGAGPLGELHTNFKLSASGEYLGLVAPNGTTIVDAYAPEFPPQTTNVSYGVSMSSSSMTLVDDHTAMRYWTPTNSSVDATWQTEAFDDAAWSIGTAGLGYENSPGNQVNYVSYLNSIVPGGTTSAYTRFEFNVSEPEELTSLTLQMLYDDGFAAYLNGQPVAAANAPANPAWNSIAEGTFRSDETVLAGYVSFDLSSSLGSLHSGTNVLAIHALNLNNSSDMLMSPRLVATESLLQEPLVYGHFATPTPNAPNGTVFTGVVADTKFSVNRGFFSAPFNVEVTTDTPGATIVYTTDGSAPAVDGNMNVTNGFVYSGALAISQTTTWRAAAFKADFIPTNVDTQTYIFLSDVIQQTYGSTLAAGFPSTWGGRPADYGLDPDVIGPNDLFDGVYAAQIIESLESVPSISLTIDNADFIGPNGIYSNPTNEGIAWERPVSAELIYPDGAEGFQIDAGLRVAGAASRSLSLKNGLRLLFKSEYGEGKLDFPLFGDGVSEFDTVVLRPHFNDGWGWDGALGDPLFARDQWFRDTQAAMGQPSSRGNLVHLYINGLYWGLYNPSERPDDSWSAETLGGDKAEYDVMVADGVHDGTADAYNTMLSLAQAVVSASGTAAKAAAYQHLQGNLPDGTNDPTAENYLDVDNYIDYMILNHYGGNNDWPNRNWYATRRRGSESEGFKFVAWDSEIALDLSDRTSIFENNLGQSTGAAQAFGILRNYDEFRLQFADRLHEHLFNGGALYVNPASPSYDPLHPENNVPAARFAALAEGVAASIVAESARWGDQHVSYPRTKNIDWQNSLDDILGTYFRDRHNIVLNQWRSAGYYPTTAAPEFLVGGNRQHGGSIEAGAALTFENPNSAQDGVIYYTTDGSDPRLVGGAVNVASAQQFNGSVEISATTLIKARILRNGTWSALTAATFTAPSADFDGNLTVNGADFLAWQRGFGASNAALADGDADQNGVVDGLDLAVWQQQFGPSTAPAVSAVTVEIAASAVDDSLFAASAPLLALASPFAGASEEVFVAASTDRSLTLMIADESPRAAAERPGPIADHVAVQVGRSARKSLADASDRDEAFSHWDHAASQLANEIAEFGGLHPSSRGPSRSRRH